MPPDAVLSVREREKQAARHPVTRLGLRCCGAASTRASAWAASVRPANVAEAVLRIRRVGRASRSTRARKVSLRANSDVLDNFGGGTGRVALHGRSGASLRDPLGSARSHGCVRMNNDVIRWLAGRVPAGTPVRVRP